MYRICVEIRMTHSHTHIHIHTVFFICIQRKLHSLANGRIYIYIYRFDHSSISILPDLTISLSHPILSVPNATFYSSIIYWVIFLLPYRYRYQCVYAVIIRYSLHSIAYSSRLFEFIVNDCQVSPEKKNKIKRKTEKKRKEKSTKNGDRWRWKCVYNNWQEQSVKDVRAFVYTNKSDKLYWMLSVIDSSTYILAAEFIHAWIFYKLN